MDKRIANGKEDVRRQADEARRRAAQADADKARQLKERNREA